jgi:predicted RNA-binding Zn ribbon-like protein
MDIDKIEMIAGHPALDYVNTVEGRGVDAVVNYLEDYDQMLRWCRRAGLIDEASCRDLARRSKEHSVVAHRVWRRAMAFREDLNAVIRAIVREDPLPDPALARINETVAEACQRRLIAQDATGVVTWGWSDAAGVLDAPVWRIALTAADLMTDDALRPRIKICANGPCDWLFLDTSRNGKRRWCRMNVCGNATKVRRFRDRQKNA